MIKQEMNEYQEQAQKFLEETKTQLEISFSCNGYHFLDDEDIGDTRDIYDVVLKRDNREFKFKFGNSVFNSGKGNVNFKEPDAYDILSCLTKYDVGSFNDFCDDYGYGRDSIKVKKIYDAVVDEFNSLKMLFTEEELEMLREIN